MSTFTAAPMIDTASAYAARLFAWWLVELKTLMPARVRRFAGSKTSRLNIGVTEDAFVFTAEKDGEKIALGRFERTALSDPSQSAALIELREQLNHYDLSVARCAPETILVRRLTLPLGLERNLRQALGLQLERLTPFKSEDVLFDARLNSRDPAKNQISVDLAVMRKATMERLAEDLAQLNLEPTELLTADKESGAVFSFLKKRGSNDFVERHKASLRLTAFCFCLALVFSFALGVKRSREINFLQDLRQSLALETSAIAPIQSEMDKLTRDYQSLRRLRAAPSMSEVLNELTRVLPDTAFLSRFRLQGRRGHVIGFAKDSGALLAHIDGSELFDKARFASPITAQGTSGWERFDITFEAAGEAGS